tara:strand:+ start:212 stop:934 length:723 start_codon:yes stop_codon:yes gene_type:complete
MSKDYIDVQGIPVVPYVDDAEGMPDIPIGTIENNRLEVCPPPRDGVRVEGFVEKIFVQFSQCPICKNSLAGDYVGSRGIPGGNVKRRSNAIYELGCGHRFHAGCLLDYLTKTETFVTLDTSGNQTESRVPIDNIMMHAVSSREGGIACPHPTCNKICYTGNVIMTLEAFIGEENETITTAVGLIEMDSEEYTGYPPREDCCTIAGRKRKTKKLKKSKRTRKQTKKRKQKLKKTKRKNSKK